MIGLSTTEDAEGQTAFRTILGVLSVHGGARLGAHIHTAEVNLPAFLF
jgi:hypothetical protein